MAGTTGGEMSATLLSDRNPMRRRDWSALSSDLLQSIADRFLTAGSLEYYIRFRSVCVSWRSATIDPSHIRDSHPPWLMLSFDERSLTTIRSFYRHSDRKTLTLDLPQVLGHRILGSSDGWLVLIHKSSAVRLFNPLTRSRIDLPPLSRSPWVIDFDAYYVGYEYNLKGGRYGNRTVNSTVVRDVYVRKVITFSAEESNQDVMMVFMICLCSWGTGNLVFARVGDDKWTEVDCCGENCHDLLFHRGRLYVIGEFGKLGVVDVVGHLARVTPAATAAIKKSDGRFLLQWYLVGMDGNLLVVCRYLRHKSLIVVKRTESVQVFMVGSQDGQRTLTNVKNLGDWMLFLGTNRSTSFNAKNHIGWKGNHIYFTTTSFDYNRLSERKIFRANGEDLFLEPRRVGDDFGVFNLEDGSVESLPQCHSDSCFIWPPPIWFTPNLRLPDV